MTTSMSESGVMAVQGEIVEGRYRHYKGGIYEVIGTARHSETEETMVVYRALSGSGGLWVRPAAMFAESVEIGGERIPRFELIDGTTPAAGSGSP
jgi:hypothetical protein